MGRICLLKRYTAKVFTKMTNYLLDTNLLLRLSDQASPDRALTEQAILKLRVNGDLLCITTQNLMEFWAVVTRPTNVNGYGWSTQEAAAEVQYLLKKFVHLPDPPDVLQHWLALVSQYDIKGRRTHDARLAAVMLAHGITHLLTFNTGDFASFTNISLVHPSDL
jgi:predicted nucleic acid-binding protein